MRIRRTFQIPEKKKPEIKRPEETPKYALGYRDENQYNVHEVSLEDFQEESLDSDSL